MSLNLYDYQIQTIDRMKNGCILNGGVGSGKSRTSLAYYYTKELNGKLKYVEKNKVENAIEYNVKIEEKPLIKKDLYIITTARKRDTCEWELEAAMFGLSTDKSNSILGIKVTVDSWNNIHKYVNIIGAFFIFDEQRVIGYGAWTKAFLRITKVNKWILLSATPGDTWNDYIPVFIANGYYKNKSEFVNRHVVYSMYSKYPKVSRYLETGRLVKIRNMILVDMKGIVKTEKHLERVYSSFDKHLYMKVSNEGWDIYKNEPIKQKSIEGFVLRKLVNSDPDRILVVKDLIKENPKVIIFYNFDYELYILKEIGKELGIKVAELNGHKHEDVPDKESAWMYLVQYSSGSEAWNCIKTNVIIFYSQNYSYRATVQASGRIDRVNTPFTDLYYYKVMSKAPIDLAIARALSNKKDFNEKRFFNY